MDPAPGTPPWPARRRWLDSVVRHVARRWPWWELGPGGPAAAPWGFAVAVTPDRSVDAWPLADHPARALVGWVAPAHWRAVGVAVRGTTHRDRGPAAVVWLCHRHGGWASWLALPGDPPVVTVGPGHGPSGGGVVPALLRAAVGGRAGGEATGAGGAGATGG